MFSYFIDSQSTSSSMFLRPSSLLPSSSYDYEIGQRKPDTPRPTSKSFCLNPSRLSLNTSICTRKLKLSFIKNSFSKHFCLV